MRQSGNEKILGARPPMGGAGPRPLILVVEDNPITLKMVSVTLRVGGYEVREACDGKSALELATSEKPDLILQDLILPDINGVDLVQQLRCLPGGAEIPIICFSGFVSRIEETRVAGAGFTDFLVKPVESSQLVRTIQTYLPVFHIPADQPGREQRVLIVDDDAVQLKLLRLLFSQRGFSVDTAPNGRTALAQAAAQRPDLIVSDILMPVMDGFQLCYALRRHAALKDTPLLLVSSHYVEEPDRVFARRIGADGYVARGDSADGIVAAALEVLRAGRMPAVNLPDPAELEAEHHERIMHQLERQASLHTACIQRTTMQGAILREISIISETLAKRGDFESALNDILAYCLDGAGLSKGALYLLENDALELQAQYGFGQALQQAQSIFGGCELCARVTHSGDALALPTDQLAQMEVTQFLARAGAASALIVPVQAPDKNLGVFVLLSRHRDLTEPDWLAFGRSLAAQIAQTILLSRTFYQLTESERRYRLLFEGASDGIFITDEQSRIVDANLAASRLSGFRLEEVKGETVDVLVPPHFRARLGGVIADYKRTGQLKGEFPLQTSTGEERIANVTGNRVTDGLYVNIFHDVTEERRRQDMIQRLAYTDTLTDLANRTALHTHLAKAIQVARARRESLGLLIMDLNDFRQINDCLGHQNGDILLIQVAGRLRTTLWDSDLVARLGGDEFAVLLPRLAAGEHIKIVVQKIVQTLEAPFMVGGVPIDVQAAIGIALHPDHGDDADTLLRRADMAMYAAKAGHQSYAIYDPATDRTDAQQLALIAELREAIHADQLVLYYQPKISLQTGCVKGMEALVRWPHATRGMILPDDFIPMAEHTGLVNPLTTWVLGNALRQTRLWRKAGYGLSISVNLSARNLQQPDIVTEIQDLVHGGGVPPAALTLEVTESAIMVDPQRAHAILAELRAFGLRISIDDFGIGHSSLAYLKELPVDQLKVDKSFVMDFTDKRNAAIVRSTIDLAHNLGLQVTAEGVEDELTLGALKAFGCDEAQGYHIGRPMPVAAISVWLKEWAAAGRTDAA